MLRDLERRCFDSQHSHSFWQKRHKLRGCWVDFRTEHETRNLDRALVSEDVVAVHAQISVRLGVVSEAKTSLLTEVTAGTPDRDVFRNPPARELWRDDALPSRRRLGLGCDGPHLRRGSWRLDHRRRLSFIIVRRHLERRRTDAESRWTRANYRSTSSVEDRLRKYIFI